MAKAKTNDGVERFFAYARARHQIYIRREAGLPQHKWTDDPILQKYRFTNVFRELDKTTLWFRNWVRDPMKDKPEVLLATVVFRMLNRIPVGEAIFNQQDVEAGNAFELFCRSGKSAHLKRAIKALLPKGPYVTGAYIITSPPGLPKLEGMMEILQDFYKNSGWVDIANSMISGQNCNEPWTLQQTFDWLRKQPWLGTFHSYEIVTDLRFTKLLDGAEDINSWCNIGPGARRGLNRVMGRDKKDKSASTEDMLADMQDLLKCSRIASYWPQDKTKFPAWEMREVEHTLCEFDKYERVLNGEGRPRGVFK